MSYKRKKKKRVVWLTDKEQKRLESMDIEKVLDKHFGTQSFKYTKDWMFWK